MFGPKIKVSPELMKKIKAASEVMGCASVEEYVEMVLSAEADKTVNQSLSQAASSKEVEDITNKLKGLGYLE